MNSRNIVTRHIEGGLYKTCVVCQYAIDQDHDDALAYESGYQLPTGEPVDYDLVPIVENSEA